jgi:hypothetical protein
MATCKICGKHAYSDVCNKCLAKGKNVTEIKNKSGRVQWYEQLISQRDNLYTTSEIHAAFELLWLDVKKATHPQDKWRYNTASFSDLLKMAWDMGLIPARFDEYINQIKNEHIPGDGMQMLESLGLYKSSNEVIEEVQECPF